MNMDNLPESCLDFLAPGQLDYVVKVCWQIAAMVLDRCIWVPVECGALRGSVQCQTFNRGSPGSNPF